VTVKAFFYDKEKPQQRRDGIFIRMKTSVAAFCVSAIEDQIPKFSSEDRSRQLGTFSVGNRLVTDVYYFVIQGKPSEITSYLDNATLYDSRAAMQYMGQSPAPLRLGLTRGRIYHQAIHTFEFGKIVSGSLDVQETQTQVDCANRYLTLGMDRKYAFASVGSQPVNDLGLYTDSNAGQGPYDPGPDMWNGFIPRLVFSPIEINSNIATDFERYRPTECLDRHPLQFEVEVTDKSTTILLDSSSRSGPPIDVRLPNLTAIPFEGREVHDIRSRIATSTATSRTASFEPHEQYCFLSAMTFAALCKSTEVSYWPALQPKTDIALPIGSTACSAGIGASFKVSLSHDKTAKDAAVVKSQEAIDALKYVLQQQQGTVPRWPDAVPLGGAVSGVPALPDSFDSMFDQYGRSKYQWTSRDDEVTSFTLGTKLGHFGDLDVSLKQTTPDNASTTSQWRGFSTPLIRTTELSTGLDQKVYTTTFVLRTSDVLWPEWNQILYEGRTDATDWNTLWVPADVNNTESGSAGVVRPYTPLTNKNAITSFITDQVVLGFRIGEDFTRYHFVDEHEATKQSNEDLKGIPPGLDINGTSFKQRWIDAKAKFRQDVVRVWTRCGDFSESVQVTKYSELRSLEARAQFVHNSQSYNGRSPTHQTGELVAQPYPDWKRPPGFTSIGSPIFGENLTGVVTAEDPVLRFGLIGNVCDVTKVDVYAAEVSFGTPTEVLVEGDLWRNYEGLRKTPHTRKYSVPCTVRFFTTLKTPTKVFEVYRAIGDSGLNLSEFSLSSETGNLFQRQPSLYRDNLARHAAKSYSVSWE
jgi:hypothetical protein